MNLLNSYKKLDTFLKMQLWVGFFYSLAWCLFIPIIHKLQGELLSVSIISLYLILSRASGLFIHILKGSNIKTWIKSMMINTILYMFAIPLYFYDKIYFLYTEMFLSILSGILFVVLHITWDLHVVKKYSNETYENYKYLEQFRSSTGGIIGYGFIIVLEKFFIIDEILLIFFITISFCLLYEIYNYKVNYYGKEF